MNTVKFLNYAWPFLRIVHERVKANITLTVHGTKNVKKRVLFYLHCLFADCNDKHALQEKLSFPLKMYLVNPNISSFLKKCSYLLIKFIKKNFIFLHGDDDSI